MEVRKGGQTLVGFPALIDKGTHVEIEVFDEPDVAAAKHRAGLRRLVALQLREPLKYLEKNIPDLQQMAVAYLPLGTAEELREQIIEVALDRAFLAEPLPHDAAVVRGAARRRPRAPDADRQRGGAAGRMRCWPSTPPRTRKLQGRAAAEGRGRRHRRAACSAWCPSASSPPRRGRSCSTCRAT